MLTIGIDLERINRFAFVQQPGGEAFYARVYAPVEQQTYGQDLLSLALCFTAKEAVAKALRTGLTFSESDRAACAEIQVRSSDVLDEPEVILTGRTRALADALGISRMLLSWTHSDEFACAVALGTNAFSAKDELREALEASLQEISARLSRRTF